MGELKLQGNEGRKKHNETFHFLKIRLVIILGVLIRIYVYEFLNVLSTYLTCRYKCKSYTYTYIGIYDVMPILTLNLTHIYRKWVCCDVESTC